MGTKDCTVHFFCLFSEHVQHVCGAAAAVQAQPDFDREVAEGGHCHVVVHPRHGRGEAVARDGAHQGQGHQGGRDRQTNKSLNRGRNETLYGTKSRKGT